MTVLKDVFDSPLTFFNKERSFREGFAWMLLSMLVFISLNQLMIELGFVVFELETAPVVAIIVNYATIIVGYFIITSVCIIPFRAIGGKDVKKLFMVVSYSLIPVLFLWIPHIVAQSIVIFLAIMLMTRGVSKYTGTDSKKSLAVTITFLVLVILSSVAVENSLLLFGNFNIFLA